MNPRAFSTGPCPLNGGIRQERWASHLWTKKRNAALGHVVLPMGLVYLPIRYTSWTRKLDHTLGIWIIDFDDEWVTYIRWMCGFTQTKLLLTLNPIHQKSVYIFICIYDTDIRISIITYNIFQYYIYTLIYIYIYIFTLFTMFWFHNTVHVVDMFTHTHTWFQLTESNFDLTQQQQLVSRFDGFGVFSSRQLRVSCARADCSCQFVCSYAS